MVHIKPLQMPSQSLIDHQISRGTFSAVINAYITYTYRELTTAVCSVNKLCYRILVMKK